jgi:HlyD family secretion protein
MSRGRLVAIGGILAVFLIGAALFSRGFGLYKPKASNGLELNGNVDIRQVDLGFRLSGRIASIPFDEGASVHAGDVLAVLDSQPLRDQLAADEAQVHNLSAQLDKQRHGNRPQEIAEADTRTLEMRAQFAKAKQDLDRRSSLIQTGAVSQADFDSTRSQYLVASAQLRSAEEAQALQHAGTRSEDVEAAAALRDQAIAQHDKALTDLADAEMRAPNDGVILVRAREPGAIVQAGDTVLTLTLNRPMRVRAYVDETDLSRISPNMAVEVRADGISKTYHGTIGFISPTAEFTPKTVQTRALRTDLVFRLRVIVSDPDDALRQGQPVTVYVRGARTADRE